eukprot:scaffold125159_cov27-Tisochrysis_lutea.AAC.2
MEPMCVMHILAGHRDDGRAIVLHDARHDGPSARLRACTILAGGEGGREGDFAQWQQSMAQWNGGRWGLRGGERHEATDALWVYVDVKCTVDEKRC